MKTNPAREAMEELKAFLAQQQFESIEEVNAAAARFMEKHNSQPDESMAGLSPNDMARLSDDPWSCPDLMVFPEHIPSPSVAPILSILRPLISAVSSPSGVRLTQKGNLPRALSREILEEFERDFESDHLTLRTTKLQSEEDFPFLEMTHDLLAMEEFVDTKKGRLLLTDHARPLIEEGGVEALYPDLLQAAALDFNWGYFDRYPEIPFIQGSFGLTIHLLKRFGRQWRPVEYYEDWFLRAVPAALEFVPALSWMSRERFLGSAYSHRALYRVLHLFGISTVAFDSKILRGNDRVRRGPMWGVGVRFRTRDPG